MQAQVAIPARYKRDADIETGQRSRSWDIFANMSQRNIQGKNPKYSAVLPSHRTLCFEKCMIAANRFCYLVTKHLSAFPYRRPKSKLPEKATGPDSCNDNFILRALPTYQGNNHPHSNPRALAAPLDTVPRPLMLSPPILGTWAP
jgi:hypothetical protein